MLNNDSVGHYTTFHDDRMTYLDSQFDLKMSFTEKAIADARPMMAIKVGAITIASAGFGIGMGVLMGSFEYNMTMGVDNNRSGWSQVRQHYYGYGRFLKR